MPASSGDPLLLFGRLQAGEYARYVDVTNAQDLVARHLAPDDEDTGLGDSQQIGEKGPTGGIGSTLDRGSSQANGDGSGAMGIECAAGCEDLVPCGPGTDADRQEDVRAVSDDRPMANCHLEGGTGLAGSAAGAALNDSAREAG